MLSQEGWGGYGNMKVVVCIHRGQIFTSWLSIGESRITVFPSTEMIKFIITNRKVRVFDVSSCSMLRKY